MQRGGGEETSIPTSITMLLLRSRVVSDLRLPLPLLLLLRVPAGPPGVDAWSLALPSGCSREEFGCIKDCTNGAITDRVLPFCAPTTPLSIRLL